MTVLQTMQEYVDACLSGEIPVCKWVRLACERHNRDLLREDIYFDEKAAEKPIKFIELMKHVKGKWAGTNLKLEPWQKFFVGSIFGWKRKDTGYRKYREANLTLPRKSGKTTLAEGIDLYMLSADGEPGAEVILGASKEPQAKELFDIALAMIRSNKEYKSFYKPIVTTETVRIPVTNSIYKFVIGKPADGGNSHGAHIEEAHEHKSDAAYSTLKNGMGAREQPLLYIASTAGSDIKCFYYKYLEYCRKVVEGIIDDDSLFSLEYTIDEGDNWEDFEVWKKANPNLGVSVFPDFLKSQHKKALAQVSSRTDILTKHLNVWNNSSTSWIDYKKWLECGDDNLNMNDFKGQECWVGLDLASRIDLCSLMFVFMKDDHPYVFGKHYINRERADLPENKHYRDWEDEGWLTVTDGGQTDFTAIENDLKAFASEFAIQELVYDPREATYLIQKINEWASFPCIEMAQSPVNFSEPMKELEAAYTTSRLHHQNDAVLNWAASNVILKNSSNKLFYPAKRNVEDKIDPIVALIMALSRAEANTTFSGDVEVFWL